MSTSFPYFVSPATRESVDLHRHWGWFLTLGFALIVVGAVAICYPVAATLTTVEVFGFLLLAGGILEIASGAWGRGWGGFLMHLLCGLLYMFLGVVMIDRPALGAAGYTLLLAVFFVAAGLFRVFLAAAVRFTGWGWAVFSGVITFFLGVLIWRNLPESALWVIGTFLGIDLMFNGWSWVMLGLAVRTRPAPAAAGESVPALA
jgi:uncharacterized membrane protein HdeD (DUF308 family)